MILNIIFSLAFASFAYVNINDKDAWLWVSIYMIASVFCGLAAFEMYFPTGYLIVIIFYLIYALRLFFIKDGVKDWIMKYHHPSLVERMKAEKPYIENAREFFGLLLISGALALNLVVAWSS